MGDEIQCESELIANGIMLGEHCADRYLCAFFTESIS